MKIGIYHERTAHTLGETECAMAVLADDLKRGHCVEIVNHCPTMTVLELAEFAGADLDGVRMRYVPYSRQPYGRGRNLCRRYRHERNWQAELSVPYDLFINFAHSIPPFCHAPVGVLFVLFPLFVPPDTFVGEPERAPQLPPFRKYLRDWYYGWQWPDRLASYQVKLAISHFTQSWARRQWNLSCPVLYPPVGTEVAVAEKSKTILSVGRFTSSDTIDNMNQLELTGVFAVLDEARQAGWQFNCVGRVSNVPVDQNYFEMVRRLGGPCGAHALANVPREQVNRLFEKAAIFWHATGLGTDAAKEPYTAEQLGISTGEAMAAGCVPLIINRGVPQELVQHGVNGFLWNDLRELRDLTTLLVQNERLRHHMSEAARQRGREFSRARFHQGFRKHVSQWIPSLALTEAV